MGGEDKMKRLKIYILSALMLSATACSDFLEKYPDTAVDESMAMKTLDDAEGVVLGIYSSLKNSALYSGYLTQLPDIQSDLVYAVKGNLNTFGDVYRWEILSTNTQITDVYAGLYKIISRCNFFMDKKDEVYGTLIKTADKEKFETRLGDVYFLRALAYSDLIKMFCEAYTPENANTPDMGISLYTSYVNPGIQPRATLEESYQFVLNDLVEAEKRVEREGTDATYITKAAVKALRARVCLYKQDWEGAAEAAQEVIDDKYLALADINKTVANTNGYATTEYDLMFEEDKSDEIIFKVGFQSTDVGGSLGKVFMNYNGSTYTPDYVPATWVLDSYDLNDGRYNTFFYQLVMGFSHGLEWPMIVKYQGNPEFDKALGRPSFINMPKILRLSEQYLIHAEACYQLAKQGKDKTINEQKANKDLTAIRRKRIKGYGSAGYTDERLFQEIKNERVKELFMEGFRLADLKRWKEGFKRTPQAQTIEGSLNNELKVTADNVLFTWPIPKHELSAANGIVKPNKSNK